MFTQDTKSYANHEIVQIILRLWELEADWEKLADPQMNWYGEMTFRRLYDHELIKLVQIQDEQKHLKHELKQRLGIWKYLKYRFLRKLSV